jgi:hypothetical protein
MPLPAAGPGPFRPSAAPPVNFRGKSARGPLKRPGRIIRLSVPCRADMPRNRRGRIISQKFLNAGKLRAPVIPDDIRSALQFNKFFSRSISGKRGICRNKIFIALTVQVFMLAAQMTAPSGPASAD